MTKSEFRMFDRSWAVEKAAQLWCLRHNAHKVTDAVLRMDVARLLEVAYNFGRAEMGAYAGIFKSRLQRMHYIAGRLHGALAWCDKVAVPTVMTPGTNDQWRIREVKDALDLYQSAVKDKEEPVIKLGGAWMQGDSGVWCWVKDPPTPRDFFVNQGDK